MKSTAEVAVATAVATGVALTSACATMGEKDETRRKATADLVVSFLKVIIGIFFLIGGQKRYSYGPLNLCEYLVKYHRSVSEERASGNLPLEAL